MNHQKQVAEPKEGPDVLDPSEHVLFPPIAFARDPVAQWKTIPFLGVVVLPRSYK